MARQKRTEPLCSASATSLTLGGATFLTLVSVLLVLIVHCICFISIHSSMSSNSITTMYSITNHNTIVTTIITIVIIIIIIVWHYLSEATCLMRPHLFSTALPVFHRESQLLRYSPPLRKACVGQVALDKRFPSEDRRWGDSSKMGGFFKDGRSSSKMGGVLRRRGRGVLRR